jgi:hypothetical protein
VSRHQPSRGRTAGEWILVGAALASYAIVALVVIGGLLNLLGLWPWP